MGATVAGVFDIESAKELFDIVENRFSQYCGEREKSTEDILSIIMMVNHLREWIAPGYNPYGGGKWPPADTPEKQFSRRVYEDPNFALIRQVCNGTKHATSVATDTTFDPHMFAWKSLFKVRNIFKGVPISHLVDGEPIENRISAVMKIYRGWFQK